MRESGSTPGGRAATIDQLKSIPRVLYRPRSTLRSLPADRLYLLAFLAPLYFTYARAVRTGNLARLTEMAGSKPLAYALFLSLAIAFIPLGALIIKLIIGLFGKKLTLLKLMNLYGYALVPRLLIAIPMSLYVNVLMPEEDRMFLILGEVPSWFSIVAVIAGVVCVYSIALYVYGIVVSPSTSAPGGASEEQTVATPQP
jgi:hypothetical protein